MARARPARAAMSAGRLLERVIGSTGPEPSLGIVLAGSRDCDHQMPATLQTSPTKPRRMSGSGRLIIREPDALPLPPGSDEGPRYAIERPSAVDAAAASQRKNQRISVTFLLFGCPRGDVLGSFGFALLRGSGADSLRCARQGCCSPALETAQRTLCPPSACAASPASGDTNHDANYQHQDQR